MRAIAYGRILASCAALLLTGATPSRRDPARLLAGRYYEQFPDGFVTGEKYTGQNIVEIVPTAASSAYFRIHLDYYNGHVCGIYGVAQSHSNALTYTDRRDSGSKCNLTIRRLGDVLEIDDGSGSCSGYCGARGTLSNVRLPYGSKRPITYLGRLKASPQYRAAIAEWKKDHQ